MLDIFFNKDDKLFQTIIKTDKKIFLPLTGVQYNSINGFSRISNQDTPIKNPAHVIEFLLRTEVLRLDNLYVENVVNVIGAIYRVYINKIVNNPNYFIGGGLVNNRNQDASIQSQNTTDGYLEVVGPQFQAGQNCYAYNINNNLIDTNSFDYVANLTGTECHFVINKEVSVRDVIRDLLIHCNSVLVLSDKIRLKRINESSVKTFTGEDILKINGEKSFKVELTPIESLYNKFVFNIYYNPAEDNYRKSIVIDAMNDYEGNGFNLYCKNVRIASDKVFEKDIYISNRLSDITNFIEKILKFYTKQKVIVEFETSIAKALALEIGDNIKINDTDILTSNYTNKDFLVTNLEYNLTKNKKSIKIRAIENPYAT